MSNIILDAKVSLSRRNLINLEEAATLTRLAERFDKRQGVLSDKDEAVAWHFINRLCEAIKGDSAR